MDVAINHIEYLLLVSPFRIQNIDLFVRQSIFGKWTGSGCDRFSRHGRDDTEGEQNDECKAKQTERDNGYEYHQCNGRPDVLTLMENRQPNNQQQNCSQSSYKEKAPQRDLVAQNASLCGLLLLDQKACHLSLRRTQLSLRPIIQPFSCVMFIVLKRQGQQRKHVPDFSGFEC